MIKYLSKKIHKFKTLFKKMNFYIFMLFRFVGGGGIPFAIQNLIPVIFDMKEKLFLLKFIWISSNCFYLNSLGAGIEKLLELSKPNFFNVILDPNIYLPILGFLIVLIISYLIKKKFFKNK